MKTILIAACIYMMLMFNVAHARVITTQPNYLYKTVPVIGGYMCYYGIFEDGNWKEFVHIYFVVPNCPPFIKITWEI